MVPVSADDGQLIGAALGSLGRRVYEVSDARGLGEALSQDSAGVVLMSSQQTGLGQVLAVLGELGGRAPAAIALVATEPGQIARYVVLWLRGARWAVARASLARLVEVVDRTAGEAARDRGTIQVGRVLIDGWSRIAFRGGAPLELNHVELSLLTLLAAEPERVHPAAELRSAVWDGADVDRRSLPVHIHALRQKLGPAAGVSIATVRGHGYRLDVQP